VYSQTCDNEPVFLRDEFVDSRVRDLNKCEVD
jgi:hypothetical protein